MSQADVLRIFETISSAWLTSIPGRLAPYLATGYSWEEWANVEAWLALHAAGFEVTPRAAYRGPGPDGRRVLGDLLVRSVEPEVMVEVKTIHDATLAKYAQKVDADVPKLQAEAAAGRATLFVLVVVAVDEERPWPHLPLLRCWSVPTELRRTARLGSAGHVVVRGWLTLPGQVTA